MAERMKDSFGPEVVAWVAEQLARVAPGFDRDAFTADCLAGFEGLELMDRGRRIAHVMGDHLPADPHVAIPLVTASLGPDERAATGDRAAKGQAAAGGAAAGGAATDEAPAGGADGSPQGASDGPATDAAATGGMAGMAPFRYLPMVLFVASHGLGAFEESMAAQHALTKRFTAEFSIRPFLVAHPEATLERLRQWTGDPDPHVRRLVSEGTRPRLPWAPRLRAFVDDPAPVVELLELLKDDDSEYVRRSVANNLNDIGKDHPELAVTIARRWWSDGDERRRALVRHGLRGLVKRGDPGALEVLGHARTDHVEVREVVIEPAEARIGQRVRIAVTVADLRGSGPDERTALDVVVHFVKASGRTAPRVFKGGVRDLAAGGTATFGCTVSVAQHSTRTHHPGVHRVEAQINGRRVPIGEFTLVE